MKVLVVGKGGREHAIACALKKSEKISKLYCAPGNGGTEQIATNVNISELNNEEMVEFILKENINFVIVTPDNPLANGMVDAIEGFAKVPCFGPSKEAAKIESSKIFAKKLMTENNIPTAKYEAFESYDKAMEYLKIENKYPTVIKADGLALGKGVTIAQNFEQASEAVYDILKNNKFGKNNKKILIEEYLEGVEASVLCFCDGNTIKPMISCMDHKRIFDGDKGPNTGGMGAIAPNPAYTEEIAKICENEIYKKTVEAMKKRKTPFSGCLYVGLMLTKNGPKVVEYNCRFGDPETQAILPLLKTDLFSIMMAIKNKELEKINIEFEEKCCTNIMLASKGYPEKYEKGFEITFNKQNEYEYIYSSGTTLKNNKLITNGGRVLSVSCIANTMKESIEKAYEAVKSIQFENMYYRKDIGKKALEILNL